MPLLGAHMSIAGGYYRAVELARQAGCDCVQLFTKNSNQWRAKKITEQEAARFKSTLAELQISRPIAHSSYLLNLATPEETLWRKSVEALVVEMERAEQLGLDAVVLHPGAFTTADEEAGIENVIRGLDAMQRATDGIRCRCLLETTAGQGTTLGWRFEQLAAMLRGAVGSERLGVCLDTCHLFAAGYPLGTADEYEETMRALDKTIGFKRIKAIHLNDSKRELGSRVDRHEHIGRGQLGLEPFRLLLNDPRFRHVPMYLETPKGMENGEDLDVLNLRTLRGLIPRS